jgi:hypothetical protein
MRDFLDPATIRQYASHSGNCARESGDRRSQAPIGAKRAWSTIGARYGAAWVTRRAGRAGAKPAGDSEKL